jgi:RNA polymerase sigma factor (sigma-70 family)
VLLVNLIFELSMLNTQVDDKDLLSLFRDESTRNNAFSLILNKYQKKIYWHVRRIVIDHDDADDVVQNTFIKVWENLSGFKEESKLYTWLFRIATNEALQFLTKKRTKFNISMNDVDYSLIETLQSGAYFNGNAAELKLQTAILTLPEKQRLVFNMKYYDALKYEEIEEILGTSVGALKASYHHAVKKIEDLLKKD